MDDDYVVFVESSSSYHLPKRHTITITINLNDGRFQSNHYFFYPC